MLSHPQLSLPLSYCVWKRASDLGYFLENYAIPSLDQAYPSCVAYNALTTIPTPTYVRVEENTSASG
jgi:hypothetical protein